MTYVPKFAPPRAEEPRHVAPAHKPGMSSEEYIRLHAGRCAEMWRAVLIQLAMDTEGGWGVSSLDRREALYFFDGFEEGAKRWREELCALAQTDPDAVLDQYRRGEFRAMSREQIGRRRYQTRLANRINRSWHDLKPGEQVEMIL